MKLSAVIAKLQKAINEHGDLDVVYPFDTGSGSRFCSFPEPVAKDQFYIGFVDQQKGLLSTTPVNPLTDKTVYVIE